MQQINADQGASAEPHVVYVDPKAAANNAITFYVAIPLNVTQAQGTKPQAASFNSLPTK